MELNYANPLPFKHISIATDEAVEYIYKRMTHEIEPLKTRWNKFNDMCCGGIEPGCVYTVAGASGTGKKNIAVYIRNNINYNRAKTGKSEMIIPW